MKNTLENKAKFLRNCIGEYVWEDNVSEMKTWLIHSVDKNGNVYVCHTKDDTPIKLEEEQLKETSVAKTPLSQITDEDAIEVAKFATHRHRKSTWKVTKIENGRVYIKDDWAFSGNDFFVKVSSFPFQGVFEESKEGEIINQLHYQFPLDAYDFIRSKGYALPWMGISVNQMIEWGWIKLKTQDQ